MTSIRQAVVATGLVVASCRFAWPADMSPTQAEVCRPFARAVTDALIKLAWERAYNYCVARDPSQLESTDNGTPIPPKTLEQILNIIDPNRLPTQPLDESDLSQIGAVPAAGPPTPPVKPEAGSDKPEAVSVKPAAAASPPQPICVKAKMRTVYSGKSWRCLK